jgi:hypothetical protein
MTEYACNGSVRFDSPFTMKMKVVSFFLLLICAFIDLISATISQADFNLGSLYEQYAAAAYCPSDTTGTTPKKVACLENGANNCPLVVAANANIVTKFA